MEKEQLGISHPSCFAISHSAGPREVWDQYQQQLFSIETIAAVGGPQCIQVADPNRPDKHRILLVGSHKMRCLLGTLEKAAPTNGTILLQGETGCGKNLLANYVHSRSLRHKARFVQFSAGHHPENLIESELFGHEEGAYTGATSARPGKIELAHQGTLFIDEVGELSPEAQMKLHRFLDDQIVERIGGAGPKVVDVRVVAATHRDLWGLVKEGRFREDLYYRLCVVCVRVPPLRERPEEIPAIATLLLRDLSQRHGKPWLRWDSVCLESMMRMPWHGNVRALRNTIEHMVILAQSEMLVIADLPQEITGGREGSSAASGSSDQDQKRRFVETYQQCRGNRTAIAKAFGTSRSQIRRLIERYLPPQ